VASINSLDIRLLDDIQKTQGRGVECNPALNADFGLPMESLSLAKVQKQIQGFDLLSAVKDCLNEGKAFSAL
jgi:hypothetical protein